MKAEELMIGDWVFGIYPNGKYTPPVCIAAVDIYPNNKSSRIVAYSGYGYQQEDLAPIPLTAEILEKNGFGYYSIGGAEQWLIKDDYYDIEVYEWSDSIWVFRYESTEMNTPHEQRTMSYLHQLQHAFKDCGIDKEITI